MKITDEEMRNRFLIELGKIEHVVMNRRYRELEVNVSIAPIQMGGVMHPGPKTVTITITY